MLRRFNHELYTMQAMQEDIQTNSKFEFVDKNDKLEFSIVGRLSRSTIGRSR